MMLCLGPTPALQRVMRFARFQLNAVNRAVETWDGLAGKAVNVAKVLHTLGEAPLLTGFLGGESGRQLEAGLAARGLRQAWVRVDAPTRQCITIVDEAAGTVTELVEESHPVPAEAYERWWDVVNAHLPGCRALIISGTLTPGAPPEFYARCVAQARAMQHLHQLGAEAVLVTAGGGPALLLAGGRWWRLKPPAIRAANPIGSGDALTAALVARRLRGDDWPEACRWGMAAGAANALTWMPGELDPATVARLLDEVQVEEWAPPHRPADSGDTCHARFL